MEDQMDPAEALALAQGARERVAARAKSSGWYAPPYGLCCGMIVAGGGMEPPWGTLVIGVGTLAVALLYAYWRRKTGISVYGFRKGRTRTIALILAAALLGLVFAGLGLRLGLGLAWGPYVCGAAAAVIGALASAAWDRAWRAELTGSGQ